MVVLVTAIQDANGSYIHYQIPAFATICSSPSLLRVGAEDLVDNRKDTLCGPEERTSRKQGCNILHWRPKRVYIPSSC